jgi:hypothetical protein
MEERKVTMAELDWLQQISNFATDMREDGQVISDSHLIPNISNPKREAENAQREQERAFEQEQKDSKKLSDMKERLRK